MIEFDIQFDREKSEFKICTLHLNKGNHEGMKVERAKVNWQINLRNLSVSQDAVAEGIFHNAPNDAFQR